MAAFLSADWFDEANDRLRAAASEVAPSPVGRTVRVVFAVSGGPPSVPGAFTLTTDGASATVEPGGHPEANLIVRLDVEVARAITDGTVDSATALREGRVKVRGDVMALNEVSSWLSAVRRTD